MNIKKSNYFETKEECSDFLKNLNFNNTNLPELEGNFDNYYVELKDDLHNVRMISLYDSTSLGYSLQHSIIYDSEVSM